MNVSRYMITESQLLKMKEVLVGQSCTEVVLIDCYYNTCNYSLRFTAIVNKPDLNVHVAMLVLLNWFMRVVRILKQAQKDSPFSKEEAILTDM